MTRLFYIITFLFITSNFSSLFGQETITIYGSVSDKNGTPLPLVNISVINSKVGVSTNEKGEYELKITAIKYPIIVMFSNIGFEQKKITINEGFKGKKKIDIKLDFQINNLGEISVEEKREKTTNLTRIDPKIIEVIPTAAGGIESILKTLPGVSSNNELSSQYTVRGGNFDENLVYLNDIEIYRPQLIRSGQQEGLSILNPDLVSSIQFSAGGFDAKYGDKMSSVLDIKYKKPTQFAGSAAMSLLGGSAHLEGCSKNHRFTHITGIRRQTSRYILNSMDTKGDYNPTYTDIQSYMTYDINEKLEISFLGYYAQNKYEFIPQTRETSFGTVKQALSLKIYFDGKELNKFITYMGALSANYKPNKNTKLTLTSSVFNSNEQETFDVQGQYYLNEIDKQIGSSNMGDSIMNIGIGTFLNHARNYLNAYVYSLNHNGSYILNDRNNVLWGVKYQKEIITDNITEWEMLDSAGFSLPYTGSNVMVNEYTRAKNSLNTNRVNAFIQNTYNFNLDSIKLSVTGGLRASYWDFNEEFFLSPRLSFICKPNWKRDVIFRLATGYYYQPAFYKEMRDIDGSINKNTKSQQSIHFVLAEEFSFKAWSRPFKFITELYYKDLNNLVPYMVDNVRLKYFAYQKSNGYAVGIDMKINGEFVKGIDSWASISVMQTKEDIVGDSYIVTDSLGTPSTVYPGYIRRPSDQLVNFGLFFQDYLPDNPSYKVHLSLLYGTRLPTGPSNSEKYQQTLSMPPYRRVDIGFSKVIKSDEKDLPKSNPFHYFKSIWLTLEVFNLLDINNTISYIWITDVNNQQYAVPNYLTSRRLNVRLIAKF